jgi:hypothetical protein
MAMGRENHAHTRHRACAAQSASNGVVRGVAWRGVAWRSGMRVDEFIRVSIERTCAHVVAAEVDAIRFFVFFLKSPHLRKAAPEVAGQGMGCDAMRCDRTGCDAIGWVKMRPPHQMSRSCSMGKVGQVAALDGDRGKERPFTRAWNISSRAVGPAEAARPCRQWGDPCRRRRARRRNRSTHPRCRRRDAS